MNYTHAIITFGWTPVDATIGDGSCATDSLTLSLAKCVGLAPLCPASHVTTVLSVNPLPDTCFPITSSVNARKKIIDNVAAILFDITLKSHRKSGKA